MFPLIAVGAVMTGALLLGSSAAASKASQTKNSQKTKESEPIAPQAYVLVPVSQVQHAEKRAQPVSVLDAVRKFVF